ncbi:Bug family tripartite tricarboxylate transporter substrate binding protein [Lacisediminimonas profundi]|uniref:Bug family tripartite tricarboxylate transporter substrate binding protein n=1 Tax=Lacisediminimonas profundi TaxID=2603856 RepID=UPI001387203B|nr:tripartite tricarboxylate transporter substrate binding protein [Lacisediminimonas profundi]
MKRTILQLAAMVLSCVAVAPLAHSGPFPEKQIKLVVGYAPGGSADIVARLLAKEMTTSMGQSVIVENKPGANALIATKEVMRSDPDGYTLLVTSLSHVVNPILNPKNADYDPIAGFSPVSLLVTLPLVAVAAHDSPFSSMNDLIQKARSAPGSVSYGSAGNGGSGHLAGALFALNAGVEMTNVPFKGNAPALTEVMAGRVSFTYFPMVGIAELVQDKRLKVLAVATKERMARFPQAPTMAEAGFPGFEDTAIWLGVIAPPGLPPEIANRLYQETRKALALASVKTRLEGLGALSVGSSPQEFSRYLKTDSERWARVIKASGIKPN